MIDPDPLEGVASEEPTLGKTQFDPKLDLVGLDQLMFLSFTFLLIFQYGTIF